MRNNSLDLLRLIACFFIIAVHVGYYPEFASMYANLFRASTRWAVPVFFLLSGFFLREESSDYIMLRIISIIKIFMISTLIYSFIIIIKGGFDFRVLFTTVLNFNLFRGVYFHLWFLPSLIIGYFGFYFLSNLKSYTLSLLICFSILFLAWLSDLLVYFGYNIDFGFFRELISIPFIFIGYGIANKKFLADLDLVKCFFLCLFFLLITVGEPAILDALSGLNSKERQFPFFCSFLSISILIFFKNLSIPTNFFTNLGKNYSLGIYLYHPFLLPISNRIVSFLGIQSSVLVLIITFFATTFSLILLRLFNERFFLLITLGTLSNNIIKRHLSNDSKSKI